MTITLITIGLIILLFGILIYNIKVNSSFENSNLERINDVQNLSVLQTSVEKEKISPSAVITFFKHYTGCNHTIQIIENVPSNIVNMSQEEFSNIYSDWEVQKFTSTEIELSKNFMGNCGEHFLVKANLDGYIDIYYIKDDGSLELKEETEIAIKYLSASDIDELKSGVPLNGKTNLNAYVENFE